MFATSRIMVALGAVFLLTAATSERPRLTFSGLGDIHIGMAAKQLSDMGFKGEPQQDWQTTEEYYGCRYITNEAGYPDIALMLNEEKLVRIETMSADWQTLSGAHVGMTIAQVRAIYGDWLKIRRHPYGDDGITDTAYLTLTSSDDEDAAIFEVFDGKVNMMRAGRADAVAYIEGCS